MTTEYCKYVAKEVFDLFEFFQSSIPFLYKINFFPQGPKEVLVVVWLAQVNDDGRYEYLVVASIDYKILTQSRGDQITTNIVISGLNIEKVYVV